MKKLPILYARGNNGKVLEWQVETDGNKFRMITGAQGFAHVTSEWSICEGKNVGRSNATTPAEQAEAEAQAKWEKKQKSGGYWLSIKDIDQTKFVEPMLANHYSDRKDKITFPVMVDRKYNGMRQITQRVGQFTRKGEKVLSAPHIFERLAYLFETHPDLVLDGELYNHDYRYKLNEIIKLVRKTKASSITPATLKESAEKVDYYVYDGYGFTVKGKEITEETPCVLRRLALKELLSGIKDVVVVDFVMADTDEKIVEAYQQYVDDGYEGAIIRVNGAYEHKRSNNLLKFKPEDDDEGAILDITDGTGNWSGAAYNVTLNWKGKTFDAVFTGPFERRAEILKEKKKWIGKEVTFTFMGLTGKGIPNSARINPENCLRGD
jgi:ATP-dependent DNA ligase